MGSLIRPSYHQGFARSAWESKYPGLWKGLDLAIVPSFGVTGDTIHDPSSYKRHGIIQNPTLTWVVSDEGIAIDFPGNTDLAEHISIPSLNKSYSEITLICHYYLDAHKAWSGLIASRSADLISLSPGASSNITYTWGGEFLFGGVSYSTGKWGTFALTVSVAKNTGTIYVIQDNILTSSVNTTYTHTAKTVDDLKIGIDDDSAGRTVNGRMTWAYIYDRELSSAEIYKLHIIPNAPFQLADIPFGFVAVEPPGVVPTPFYYNTLLAGMH